MKLEIEIFRILSMFGIVWFHSPGIHIGRDIAYGGLIFFVVVSVYFATISMRQHRIFERIERLLIPYLLWAVFYAVIFFLTKGHIFPQNYTLFSMVLASPTIHLWFLPFIFLTLVIIDYIRPILSKEWFATMVGVSAILLIFLAPIWRDINYISPLGQYAHAFPAILVGIFLGVMDKVRMKRVILAGILVSIAVMIYKQQSGVGITYLVGFIPCYFLFKGQTISHKNALLLKISAATFGVYLSHIFVLMILSKIGFVGLPLPIFAFLLSLLAVMIFKAFAPKFLVKYVV